MGPRLLCLSIVAITVAGCGDSDAPHPAPGLAVARVYMGVSCPRPNSIRCDRVGLAVWLPTRAARLHAAIAGRPVRMTFRGSVDDPRLAEGTERRLAYYEGFLMPAGLLDGPLRVRPDGGRYHWTGRHPVNASVRLVARYGHGEQRKKTLRTGLAAGWG